MSSLKKRNIVFYDKRRIGGDLTVDIPSTDYIKKTFDVKLSASDVILDSGCGVCSHLLSLDCDEKVGLDISLGNLTVAKKRSKNLHLIRGDVESLPFKDRAFDAVLIVSLLHHVPNHELALDEISRVIREEGHLFIADSSVTGIKLIYPIAVIIQYFTNLFGSPEAFGPKLDEIYFILRTNGFVIKEMKVSTTFISYLYKSVKGFIHYARRLPFVNVSLCKLIEDQERFLMSLDTKALFKLGSKFGVWFNLVAVKNKLGQSNS